MIKSKDGFSVDHKGGKLREHWWPDSRVVLPRYFVVVCFKMAVSKAVLSMIRVLAIFHIVVGALLIIFGIADGVTAVLGYEYMFIAGYGFYGVWIGTWVSVHVQISAFVRYNIFLAFPVILFSCIPTRSSGVRTYIFINPLSEGHYTGCTIQDVRHGNMESIC